MNPQTRENTRGQARYILTGGGTAGHVYPALAIQEAVLEQEPEATFAYLGTRNGAEERIVPGWGIPLKALPVRGLPSRKNPVKVLAFLLRLLLSAGMAARTLLRFKPRAIIGTGGYASAPVFLAALILRPLGLWKGILALHEQNIIPGRSNLWMSRGADFIGTSFPDTGRCFPKQKVYQTGYPIRKSVREASARAASGEQQAIRERLGIPPSSRVMLVFGGSSGARAINEVLLESLPGLLQLKDLHIVHATGYPQGGYDPEEAYRQVRWDPEIAEAVRERYHRQPYLDPMAPYYGLADLVVGRSGAGSVWEMAAANVPGLLIPKAGLPGDHQVKNARFFERHGRARVLYESGAPPGAGNGAGAVVDPDAFLRDALALLARNAPDAAQPALNVPCGSTEFARVLHAFLDGHPVPAAAPRTQPSEASPGGAPGAPPSRPLEWVPLARLPDELGRRRRRGEEISEPDRRYVRSKTDRLLRAGRWQDRNLGVKIAGLTGDPARLPTLLGFVTDRTPAPLSQRLLGGDFRQVGFIRRNALQAVWRIGAYNASVKQALLQAFGDPYFEVRSWAAVAVLRLADRTRNDPDLERGLRANLRDRWFEVIASSLEALAEISTAPDILADLAPLLQHRNWKVQEATVRCLMRLMERGIVRLDAQTEARMQATPMKGLDFSPRFPLQETWEDFQDLRSRSSRGAGSPQPD